MGGSAEFVGPDDVFEDNDTCLTPAALGLGCQFALFVSETDPDYYALCAPAAQFLRIDFDYWDFSVKIRARLLLADCTTQIGTVVYDFDEIHVDYLNGTGVDQPVILEVTVEPGLDRSGFYNMDVTSTGSCRTAPFTYCTGKLSSPGCLPQIFVLGTPSVTSPLPFQIDATDVVNFKNGLVFYGINGATGVPFSGGTLCVVPPLRRATLQNSGGSPPNASDCTGQFAFDFNAWIQSGVDPLLSIGQAVNAQYWFRDPPATSGAGLSNAVELEVGP